MDEAHDLGKTANAKRFFTGALLVALVLSILTVFSVIGTPILNPLTPHLLSGVSLAAEGENAAALVDQGRMRILFVNNDMRISSVARVGNGEVPIDEVGDVAVGDGVVYVSGLKRGPDGEAIISEAVLSYTMRGNYLKTLWETHYEEDSVHAASTIVDLKATAEGVMVARTVGERGIARSVQLFTLDSDANRKELRTIDLGEPVYDASYDIVQDRCYVITARGASFAEDGDGGLKSVADDQQLLCKAIDAHNGCVVMQDASLGGLWVLPNSDDTSHTIEVGQASNPRCVKLSDDTLFAVLSDGSLLLQDLSTQDVRVMSEIELAPRLALRFAGFGVSIVFLAMALFIWGKRKFRELVKNDQRDKIREVVLALMSGAFVVIVTNYFAYVSIKSDWELRKRELLQMSSYLSYVVPDYLGEEDVRELRLAGAPPVTDEQPALKKLEGNIEGLVRSARGSDIGIACKVYALSEDGSNATAIFSTERDMVPGETVFDEAIVANLRGTFLSVGTAEGDGVAERAMHACSTTELILQDEALGLAYVPLVTSGGTCWGVAQISTRGITFARQFMTDSLKTALSFSIVAIGMYLLTEEFLKCGGATLNYRNLRTDGAEWSYTALARPLHFLLGLASGMDYALVAVMAREILLSSGANPSSFVLSLPFLAATIGGMISQLTYADLSKNLSLKGFMASTTAAGIAGQCLCLFALMGSRFDLYVIGRFVMSAGYGLTMGGMYGIPYRAPGGVEQLNKDVSEAGKSSGLIAGVLGGLVVGVGNKMIYITSVFFGVLLLGCFLVFLPLDRVRDSEKPGKDELAMFVEKKKKGRKRSMAFLFSPPMLLSILFGLVPLTIAGGYRSYVFPLFLNSVNLESAQIANLWVVCDALRNLIISELRPYKYAHNRWTMSWLSMLFLGVTFAMFSRNQSIAWAVLAAIVIGVLRWFASSCRHCARSFGRKEYDLDANQAYALVSNTETVVKNVRSVAMGAFLSLGTVLGCLALGAYFAVSGLIYALATHSHYTRSMKK